MNKGYKVYKHTTPSGKCYIGITRQRLTKRWKNGQGYKGCTAFFRAIEKYGWENISHEILAEGLTEEDACTEEQKYIKLFRSADPAYGYNLTHGGEHYCQTDQSREALRKSLKKYYSDKENRKKVSERQIGKRASAETRQKMSEARSRYIKAHPEARDSCRRNFLGKKRSQRNCELLRLANEKPVLCVDTGVIFPSTIAAAKYAGVSNTAVTNNIHGRSKMCGGHVFRHADAPKMEATK